MLYDVYDVYDDSRRYTNATNTPTSDIMKEMVPYLPHRSSVCVVYWEGWGADVTCDDDDDDDLAIN